MNVSYLVAVLIIQLVPTLLGPTCVNVSLVSVVMEWRIVPISMNAKKTLVYAMPVLLVLTQREAMCVSVTLDILAMALSVKVSSCLEK